jgi:hypothetical protein
MGFYFIHQEKRNEEKIRDYFWGFFWVLHHEHS